MRIRERLTFANVVSCFALFIALGGGAYAITLKKNSVKSKQIKNGQVKTADLADGGVGAVDLADNAVGAAKIADGGVGGAEIADGSVGLADAAPSLRLNCPAGTTYVAAACVETAVRQGFAQWHNAAADCRDEGRRLPSIDHLQAYRAEGGAISNPEWTGSGPHSDIPDSGPVQSYAIAISSAGVQTSGNITSSIFYRCVANPAG